MPEEIDFTDLDLVLAGRDRAVSSRLGQTLALRHVVGFVEKPVLHQDHTVATALLLGVDGQEVIVADDEGRIGYRQLAAVADKLLLDELNPVTAYVGDQLARGEDLRFDTQLPELNPWTLFVGRELKAEHLIQASAGAGRVCVEIWQEHGCTFARYTGSRMFRGFAFPDEAGKVIEIAPEADGVDLVLFAGGQRFDLTLADELRPITDYPPGTPAGNLMGDFRAQWAGLTTEAIERLTQITHTERAGEQITHSVASGDRRRAAAELFSIALVPFMALEIALRGGLPIGARRVEFASRGQAMSTYRSLVAAHTGNKPSWLATRRAFRDVPRRPRRAS
ncbi:hypothetical protein [Glutamicibacter sp. PS]|uniref:hypothetical protein n=1 Tax=Glutamicibacter sp. PS TaxID=3075634 RepID=UPI00284C9684|nr:hypothetical protein [Glutamicibacter sp. PS]MDR4532935.1 hypothetical protein [Glutamicibacter sp. PS]